MVLIVFYLLLQLPMWIYLKGILIFFVEVAFVTWMLCMRNRMK